jgi:myo-inositol-1(or 4)-monophosphatase
MAFDISKHITGYKKELYVAKKLARVAGGVVLDEWGLEKVGLKPGYREKHEFVTSADLHSEMELIEGLHAAFPDHSILSEEKGYIKRESDYLWLIDPLDGTTNYVSRNPYWAVSIALAHKDKLLVGVVFAPALKETFVAIRGRGAFLERSRIHVAHERDLEDALISLGAPRQFINAGQQRVFSAIAESSKHLRWFGSAALDLAYVACGRIHACVRASMPKPWDLAAGALLVSEAGGVVTDFEGNKWRPELRNVIAANSRLHKHLRELVEKAK